MPQIFYWAINNKEKNNSITEYSKEINITLFDYFCPGKNINKRRMVELYDLAKDFYRKRMDIVLAFSHLLLTEKFLLRNNYGYNYYLCKEIELLYPKT